jgi:hypothetical protein
MNLPKLNSVFLTTVATALLPLVSPMLTAQQGGELLSLTQIKTGMKSGRVSSAHPEGRNQDWIEIEKAGTADLCKLEGAGYINHIWITIAPPPEELNRNRILIRMYWDGNEFPSVESPLGAFFGQGWDESYEFKSLPLATGPLDGRALVSYFVMPYAKGARVEIVNYTGRKIPKFYYYVDYVSVDELPADTGRFHAWFNHELTGAHPDGENEWGLLGEEKVNNTDGKGNYLIADIRGRGHFVGVNYYIHSPTPQWYGEGDDMFFIDGEKLPSIQGTGTEDYFNTSWCPNSLYDHPYFGAARVGDSVGWLGRHHVYRFHVSDPIYFDKSLRFSIEHGHANQLNLDVASVAYWYQAPPLKPLPKLTDEGPWQIRPDVDFRHLHQWRDAWRKSKGNDPKLWGTEGLR